MAAEKISAYVGNGTVAGYGAHGVDSALQYFKRKGWLRTGDNRGELYPTPKGWRAVEKAARVSRWGRR